MKDWPLFAFNQDFQLFGAQHWVVLVAMVSASLGLPWIARHGLNPRQQLRLSRIMAVLISFAALAYPFLMMWLGVFDYRTDLPLDVCNLTALLLPFVMWRPTLRMHEILYFWVLGGTLQAIVTPHLFNGFPNFIFLKYWIVHAGLVVYVIYATVVFELRPTLRSLRRSFLALQGYVLFILIVNLLIGANYVYVLSKPPTASALDYLGPWPWYLLVAEGVALLLFGMAYLPFTLLRRQKVSTE
ncbi:MAG: TIGR02206 family membrane protein [Lewinella sp.]|nr:TIGR02206 family membrane protein [Lewinella sp.]